MTISGINPAIHDSRLTHAEHRSSPVTRENQAPVQSAVREANDTPVVNRSSARPIPAEAPPGTDPALWSVLTNEERSYFARAVTAGPLTYTKMMGHLSQPTSTALPRGGRMDVRV